MEKPIMDHTKEELGTMFANELKENKLMREYIWALLTALEQLMYALEGQAVFVLGSKVDGKDRYVSSEDLNRSIEIAESVIRVISKHLACPEKD